ncbi:TolC family protein [Glaciecola sp. 33A]|uniref:TolC family protein n=1 Tax=Glaciecola sp. 33A TaxID=2057807 RepID=UPI000C33E80B|nr:TolC family protein [Glaciecola sp. 33A]PKI03325.1 transporter [Glaciecola sp. 33A]
MKFFKVGHLRALLAGSCSVILLNSAMLSLSVSANQSGNKHHDNQLPLSLTQAVSVAIANDPWLTRSKLRQKAMMDTSEAVDALPNPIVSIGLANLPTDGFVFDQEPMTQLKAGVMQQFPRGNSLEIQRKQLQELALQHPLLRQDRIAKTKVMVSSLWLEVYRAQQIVALIENDRALFQQLAEIIQVSYSSAVGKVRQQDIVRVQLELTRLDDRLNTLMSQKEQAGGQLLEWLSNGHDWQLSSADFTQYQRVSTRLPMIAGLAPSAQTLLAANDKRSLAQLLSAHPAVLAIEQRIDAGETAVELAKQSYKSQWGVNASYAYRADDHFGRSRADLFSIGVSFDLPLLTQSSQDKKVSAAVREAEAIKTDKLLALRGLLSQLQSTWSRYQRLRKRQLIFDDSILVQIREQAEASLTAYTNDDGDFSDVVRAHIDDLNVRIDVLNIQVDLLKAQVELNYFFATAVKVGE